MHHHLVLEAQEPRGNDLLVGLTLVGEEGQEVHLGYVQLDRKYLAGGKIVSTNPTAARETLCKLEAALLFGSHTLDAPESWNVHNSDDARRLRQDVTGDMDPGQLYPF